MCYTDIGYSLPDTKWLWYCDEPYNERNPFGGEQIKAVEKELEPIFEALTFETSNSLFELLYRLCTAYRRHAFREGVRIGAALKKEVID